MTTYPTFAQLRAERAARQIRGVIIPFPETVKAFNRRLDHEIEEIHRQVDEEIAAENALATSAAPTWGELWIHLIDLWGDICLDTLDVMRHAALAALDGDIIDYRIIQNARQDRMVCQRMEIVAQAQERNRQAARQAEAEHTGQLIRELFEEA
jgi:hypothetical protein